MLAKAFEAKKEEQQSKQIAVDGKNFESEDKRQAALRFQEQCHLMLKWEEITAQNVDAQSTLEQQTVPAFYKNFAVIDHDTPFDLINRMFNKGKESDLLFTLTSEQLSILVPTVRIFKIYVDPLSREEYSIELPFEDYMSKQEIAKITKTKAGRGSGAGLNSFTWKTEGRTPANRFQFMANMSLHFQSIEDIFTIRETRNVQFASSSSKRQIDVRFSDLLIQPKAFRKGANTGPRAWDLDYFKIKVVLGWAVPKFKGVDSFIPRPVRDVLSRTFNSFILGIFDHDMKIEDNGTVNLSINFNTLPELMASQPLKSNILFPSSETNLEIQRLNLRLSRLEKEIKEKSDIGLFHDEYNEQSIDPQEGGVSLSNVGEFAAANSQFIESKKKERNEILKQLSVFDNSKKSQSYRRILSGLFDRDKLHYTMVKKEYLDKRIRLKNREFIGSPEQIQASVKLVTAERNVESSKGPSAAPHDLSLLASTNEVGDKDFSKALNTSISKINQGSESEKDMSDSSSYKIIYFYFGDLMDVVMDGMFKKKITKPDSFENKELKILLGSLTFYDYGNLEEHGLSTKRKGIKNDIAGVEKVWTGKMSSVNLADIPISLREFTAWFNKTIVAEGKETFPFREFLEKAINDLVVRAIKTECYDYAPRQKINLTYKPFTCPANTKRTQLFREKTRVTLQELEEVPFISEEHRSLSEKSEMENYILIHASVENPWDLTGDYEEDRQRGVFHIFYGEERGLVKSINFKRVDQPYIRAANIAGNFNDSQGTTKLLRGIYDAEIEMVGNNLFTVGSQLRIVPSLGGGGSTEKLTELAEDLGIGGYFLVLEREDEVESGVYNTKLNTVWVSQATKRKGGRLDNGELENNPRVVRSRRRTTENSPSSESNKETTTGGDIGKNVNGK